MSGVDDLLGTFGDDEDVVVVVFEDDVVFDDAVGCGVAALASLEAALFEETLLSALAFNDFDFFDFFFFLCFFSSSLPDLRSESEFTIESFIYLFVCLFVSILN